MPRYRTRLCPLPFLAVLLIAAPCEAQRWSPDGRWIAFVHAESSRPPIGQELTLAWLLGEEPQATSDAATREERLWAVRVGTNTAVPLDQTKGRLTEPSWSRNGSALVYGRLTADSAQPGGARFEVIFQNDVDRKRVVQAWTWQDAAPTLSQRNRREVALSPDGSLVVAPMLQPDGLILLRVADGKPLRRLPGAALPEWSADQRLVYVQAGNPTRVMVLDSETAEPSAITELTTTSDTASAPHWTRDSQTLHILTNPANGVPRLERWRAPKGKLASRDPNVLELSEFSRPADPKPAPVDFGFDYDEEQLFQTTQRPLQPAVITWMRPHGGGVFKRYSPLLESLPIQGLSVSPRPNTRLLAFRPSLAEFAIPPGISDPESESFEPLVPDEAAREAWISLLVEALGDIIDTALPPQPDLSWSELRPTKLPIPGELAAQDPVSIRLKRLARIGRAVLEQAQGEQTDLSAERERNSATAMLFDYLTDNFPGALKHLDTLELQTQDSHARLRLLGLRAQMHMGQKRFDASASIVDYLDGVRNKSKGRIEQLPFGTPIVSENPDLPIPWLESLRSHNRPSSAASADDEPLLENLIPSGSVPRINGVPGGVIPFDPQPPR